ncbi:MAG TPA: TOBE domain-containing protein [Thermoleophilaceae bacterium]|nr:TOBE domain-containing protein [Thermoleophilaceae bacterium]
MDRGRLCQVATPQALYEMPANVFVARFMGSPPMNLLIGRIAAEGDGLICHLADSVIDLPEGLVAARPALKAYVGRELIVGVRPDAFALRPPGEEGLAARVYLSELLGSESLVHVETDARAPHGDDGGGSLPPWDAAGDGVGRLSGRFAGDTRGRAPGDAVTLALDPARFELFDLDSGAALARVESHDRSGAVVPRP